MVGKSNYGLSVHLDLDSALKLFASIALSMRKYMQETMRSARLVSMVWEKGSVCPAFAREINLKEDRGGKAPRPSFFTNGVDQNQGSLQNVVDLRMLRTRWLTHNYAWP